MSTCRYLQVLVWSGSVVSTYISTGTWLTAPSQLSLVTFADLSSHFQNLHTSGYGSGSPASALVPSLNCNFYCNTIHTTCNGEWLYRSMSHLIHGSARTPNLFCISAIITKNRPDPTGWRYMLQLSMDEMKCQQSILGETAQHSHFRNWISRSDQKNTGYNFAGEFSIFHDKTLLSWRVGNLIWPVNCSGRTCVEGSQMHDAMATRYNHSQCM